MKKLLKKETINNKFKIFKTLKLMKFNQKLIKISKWDLYRKLE